MFIAQGKRIGLRMWQVVDLPAWIALNADPQVRAYFPSVLNASAAQAEIECFQQHERIHGFTLWAVVEVKSGTLLGMTGLWRTRFQASFTPCVEIAWRFARHYWGQGYALEAAQLAMQYGFIQGGLKEIVAFTAQENRASERLMQRLGMRFSGIFPHPALSANDRLSPHVLYRRAVID